MLLLPALAAGGPAGAAGARASASAQVIEPITVNSLLGAPVTLEGILAAWRAAQAGPQTGG
ncbi:hypothetical protein, partial [Pelomonas sp. KK5]|uniref:hypothetical protein n=1 Tax=Pelomonas sp. KK5 TaxID=1855730 RepID=UPI00117E538A